MNIVDFPMNADTLLDNYMDYVLTNGKRPTSVYVFAKENGMEEQDFYRFYSGFSQIEREFFHEIFRRTIILSRGMENYVLLSARERLLNFYFIFIENLTLNRSFVLFLLANGRTTFESLAAIRPDFFDFTENLPLQELPLAEKLSPTMQQAGYRTQQELLWKHFLSVIDFWRKDTSTQFEKTDIFIEKTVDTVFTLVDSEPLRKVLDLGKFLWKEKLMK